jgi:D-serine dehydratase
MASTAATLIDPFDTAPLDWTYKGLPELAQGMTRHQFGALRLPLFGGPVLFPMAVVHDRILEENAAWMREFLGRFGAVLAPHGKTTMSPDLMQMQLQNGAWALSAATVHHVRAYRSWGARRIILANQLVGDAEIDWIARELEADPDFDFYCLVDSVEAAGGLERRLAARPAFGRLKVLVEIGTAGGRTGVRTLEEGITVVEAIARMTHLALSGIETFEGLFQVEQDGLSRARAMLDMVVALGSHCDRRRYFWGSEIILSGGGSGLFDVAAEILAGASFSKPARVVVRSGCYIVHDDEMYRRLFEQLAQRTAVAEPGLRSALQIWALVLSKPEPGRMICGLGKRDIGADCGPPKLVGWVPQGTSEVRRPPAGCAVTALNDQHAYVDGNHLPFKVGDLVGFGVSHPCTTFDKWRAMLTVDEGFRITGLIRTYF